jgi:DNA-binding transcriptional ArsR family regulator
MSGDADVAGAAALIGEPARAAFLLALTEADALPAQALAERARVAPSTASAHLARLHAAGLIAAERRGRHRYFRLARPEVAAVLEALAVIAPARPVHSLREASAGEALRLARTCYDHVAGRLGVELAAALERERVVIHSNGGYALGRVAPSRLSSLGIDLEPLERRRRALVRSCLDWSERRPHLAGALGAALAERLFALGWVERRSANRSLAVTDAGWQGLRSELGIDVDAMVR